MSKFDGATWTTYTSANSGLADNIVISIAIDNAGNKWFGTISKGVSKYDGTTWTAYTTTNGLADNRVKIIAVDSAGNKWVGTSSGVSLLTRTHLDINHTLGKPGSYFTLTGSGYPAGKTATITINGNTIGTVQTDSNGAFTFELSTNSADEGVYFVTVSVNPGATIRFTLDANSPDTWPSSGSGTSFDVPAGIAFTELIYLPLIQR